MLVAAVLAAVLVLPGFVLLDVLDQRGLLPEEGVDDVADRVPDRRVVEVRAAGGRDRQRLEESGR